MIEKSIFKDGANKNLTHPNRQKGITLVSLVITIIVLLILAGIAITSLTGSGLIEKTKEAQEKGQMGKVNEEIKLVLNGWQIEKAIEKKSIEEFLNEKIEKKEIDYITIGENIIEIEKSGYVVVIDNEGNIIEEIRSIATRPQISSYYSLEKAASEISENKYDRITIVGDNEVIQYDINAIVYNGNLVLDGQTNVEGSTLADNVYEFGNAETDVATSTEYAKNMVVLKVNGNLTINEGVTLTACKSSSGYGGPKGMMIYCTGTITNNGTISMTARGAKAVGENVYLWKNEDGSYEYVPAVGATGGEKRSNATRWQAGNVGTDGTGRETGGGGSGGCGNDQKAYSSYGYGGAGGTGTSYSGGAGGGAARIYAKQTINGGTGSSFGGEGGNAVTWSSSWGASGGAGNPGGTGTSKGEKGNNGTGGLLIIYANSILNYSNITSNGVAGGNAATGGGSSGGGSINIFLKSNLYENSGKIVADGGSTTSNEDKGGNGGQGTVSIGYISTGTYMSK